MAMFFDMTTMPQFDQIRAIDQATKFIKEQMTSSDLIQIMNYGTKLNVLQEFTDDRELLLTTLSKMVVGEGAELDRVGPPLRVAARRHGAAHPPGNRRLCRPRLAGPHQLSPLCRRTPGAGHQAAAALDHHARGGDGGGRRPCVGPGSL